MVSPCLPHPAQRSIFKSKQAFSRTELFYYTTLSSASVFLEKCAENFPSGTDYLLSHFTAAHFQFPEQTYSPALHNKATQRDERTQPELTASVFCPSGDKSFGVLMGTLQSPPERVQGEDVCKSTGGAFAVRVNEAPKVHH
jgi:hypothetical protein